MEIPQRFVRQINKTDTCWLWTGHINKDGYGRYNGKGFASGYVHRQMFYLEYGYLPKPPLSVVGHLCEIRNCVNPQHLVEQTQQQNVKQYMDRITHCPKGHEYDEKNTYFRSNGRRKCRACNSENEARKRLTKRQTIE